MTQSEPRGEQDDAARRPADTVAAAPLRGLSTVNLFAADHAAARDWYTQFLGVAPYFERPGYVEFRIGDYQTELGIIDSKYVPGTQSHGGRAGVVAYWHVEDVDAVLAKAVGMGATQLEAPEDRGHGFITATAVDPSATSSGSCTTPITWRSCRRSSQRERGGWKPSTTPNPPTAPTSGNGPASRPWRR
jgi:predicted enzyme related to lactoylglutathione lyase